MRMQKVTQYETHYTYGNEMGGEERGGKLGWQQRNCVRTSTVPLHLNVYELLVQIVNAFFDEIVVWELYASLCYVRLLMLTQILHVGVWTMESIL